MQRTLTILGFGIALIATPAAAAPGLGDTIYPATIEPGVTEFEARYGRLTGGPDDGGDALKLEVEHGFSTRFAGAIFTTLGRDPGGSRSPREVAFEGIAHVGRIGGIDVGAYAEYAFGLGEPDALELKALFSRKAGRFDGRLNLIAEKGLNGSTVEFGYAASADWQIVGELRAGFAAFGEAGDFNRFLGRHEHFIGPILKTEIEHLPIPGEIGIEAGYLFAIPGAARAGTDGQIRLLLEWEGKF